MVSMSQDPLLHWEATNNTRAMTKMMMIMMLLSEVCSSHYAAALTNSGLLTKDVRADGVKPHDWGGVGVSSINDHHAL